MDVNLHVEAGTLVAVKSVVVLTDSTIIVNGTARFIRVTANCQVSQENLITQVNSQGVHHI
jgi:hypothetical protein